MRPAPSLQTGELSTPLVSFALTLATPCSRSRPTSETASRSRGSGSRSPARRGPRQRRSFVWRSSASATYVCPHLGQQTENLRAIRAASWQSLGRAAAIGAGSAGIRTGAVQPRFELLGTPRARRGIGWLPRGGEQRGEVRSRRPSCAHFASTRARATSRSQSRSPDDERCIARVLDIVNRARSSSSIEPDRCHRGSMVAVAACRPTKPRALTTSATALSCDRTDDASIASAPSIESTTIVALATSCVRHPLHASLP